MQLQTVNSLNQAHQEVSQIFNTKLMEHKCSLLSIYWGSGEGNEIVYDRWSKDGK